jgi:pimeloyl-ACP methyl ester carboxylesterase
MADYVNNPTRRVQTGRIAMSVREVGAGEPVIFVHGNVSTGGVWDEQLAALPDGLRGVAVDLRGYGDTETKPVDATRGVRDWSDDLRALVEALDLGPSHLVAHSLGAAIVLQYAIDHPGEVRSLTLAAPMSPYGFGGTRDENGTPCHDDFAGSGGGAVNPELPRRIAAGDRTTDNPASPRNVIRSLFFPSPETVRDEEAILDAMLSAAVGDDNYPGDAAPSPNWPHTAPGTRGALNAFSPKYCDVSGFAASGARAPVLWVRGARDAVVADGSPLDFAVLGQLGVVPGWPGAEVYPAQPMVSQLRKVLTAYVGAGGSYREEIWDGVGHFPFTQEPVRFATLLAEHLRGSMTDP